VTAQSSCLAGKLEILLVWWENGRRMQYEDSGSS
jgi:hypothetical protein